MADFSKHQVSGQAVLTPRLPNGELSDAKITLAGQDSEVYQKEIVKFRREQIDRAIDSKKEKEDDSEDIELRLLVACTISWEGIEWEGKPMECTPENALKLYSNSQLGWLKRQVDRFIHTTGNYLGKSSKG